MPYFGKRLTWGFHTKQDILERVATTKFNRDMKLLSYILEYIGFDEPFTKEDVRNIRRVHVGNGKFRAYFGDKTLSRLINDGLIDASDSLYYLTLDGREKIEQIETLRDQFN